MAYIIRVMGVVFLLSCLVAHQIFRQDPCLSVEAIVNPTGENALVWNPAGPGHYFLYLRCDAGTVSQEIRENFMNWQIGPKANWAASLSILTNRNLCFSQNSLTLKPAIKSGNDLYFLIGGP